MNVALAVINNEFLSFCSDKLWSVTFTLTFYIKSDKSGCAVSLNSNSDYGCSANVIIIAQRYQHLLQKSTNKTFLFTFQWNCNDLLNVQSLIWFSFLIKHRKFIVCHIFRPPICSKTAKYSPFSLLQSFYTILASCKILSLLCVLERHDLHINHSRVGFSHYKTTF